MRKVLNIVLACLFTTLASAQENPVKIVFDVTSSNTGVHESTMRHVKMMSNAYPDSMFEVVMYSGAYEMVVKDKSAVSDEMEALAKNNNVDFVVCQASLNRHEIDVSQLVAGVRAVPDGILEIIQKQGEGWGYIKEGQ
ncbi:DsrE family protein [Maribacter arenosus]|uniref:DsrE family protein n=1 Tax=Maribacter arenosus TaxID=1854708 RepID=A0ABR7VEM9_9FLAO|nr:DsrE family protein [Maribacter arenosus]MBD0852109.1 DsrE family protein [Maribacter arenosus]